MLVNKLRFIISYYLGFFLYWPFFLCSEVRLSPYSSKSPKDISKLSLLSRTSSSLSSSRFWDFSLVKSALEISSCELPWLKQDCTRSIIEYGFNELSAIYSHFSYLISVGKGLSTTSRDLARLIQLERALFLFESFSGDFCFENVFAASVRDAVKN